MYIFKEYKYCPKCANPFSLVDNHLKCNKCGYNIYDNPKPCVNAIIENDKGEILLVVRKENPFKGWLDLPGGFIESGETVEKTAKREIKEELGLELKVGKMIGNYSTDYEYQGVTYKILVFYLSGKTDLNKIKVGDDVADYKFVAKNQILKERICSPEVNKTALREYLKLYP